MVPKTQDAKTRLLQMLVPFLIPFVFQMLTAINFDHQAIFKADEIKNIIHERMLPAKLATSKLARPQKMP